MRSTEPDLETRIDCFAFNLDRMTKKNVFGGRGYFLNGNYCFGTYQGHLVFRASRKQAEELLKSDHIQAFDYQGLPKKGWLMMGADHFKSDEKLNEMLRTVLRYISTLHVKPN